MRYVCVPGSPTRCWLPDTFPVGSAGWLRLTFTTGGPRLRCLRPTLFRYYTGSVTPVTGLRLRAGSGTRSLLLGPVTYYVLDPHGTATTVTHTIYTRFDLPVHLATHTHVYRLRSTVRSRFARLVPVAFTRCAAFYVATFAVVTHL